MDYEHTQPNKQPDLNTLYANLLTAEPKIVTDFIPDNASAQQQAFLLGEIDNPAHTYGRLDGLDFEERRVRIDALGAFLESPDLDPKYATAYTQCIENYQKKTRLLEFARDYKHAKNADNMRRISDEYMQLNIDLYGAPEEETYRSLLAEKLRNIASKELNGEAAKIRDELLSMVNFESSAQAPERFRPSPETVEWMRDVVDSLYGGMLSHVPENQQIFSVSEVQAIFSEIIVKEFGEAAVGWRVDIEPAKSINVKSGEKRIVIPEDKGNVTRTVLRKLIVHEIGVHMLRAVTGGETDLPLLANGLNEYYDAEEGLGVVMEQALEGGASERGVDHYITAGLAYFDGKNFRDIFEAKWRIAVLEGAADDGDISSEQVEKAQKTAYAQTMRIMRGTDQLPWFKDLAYYNGSNDIWRHLEAIRGDDIKFMFVLLGKANPANIEHERLVYETRTV